MEHNEELIPAAPMGGRERSSPWLQVGISALLAVATFFTFLPTLRNGFVTWDDPIILLVNRNYRAIRWENLRWMFTTLYANQYHPLTWLSYALDYQLWGIDWPQGYHLTSLCLHILNAVVFFFLARELLVLAHRPQTNNVAGGSGGHAGAVAAHEKHLAVGAAVAALFFALHPLRVETVAWATERRGVLCATLYLLALLTYMKSRAPADVTPGGSPDKTSAWYLSSVAFAAAALLSKSMAVSIPFVLLILDVYPLQRLGGAAGWFGPAARRVWAEKAPFFLIALAGTIIAPVAQGEVIAPLRERGIMARLANMAYAAILYLRQTLFPLHLSPFYRYRQDLTPFALSYVLSGMEVVAISALTWAMRPRWPAGLAAWLAYAVMVAPVIGILPLGHHVAADRYTYLPCLPWALLAGVVALRLLRPVRTRPLALGGIVVILAAFAVLTWRQTSVWRDGLSLWRQVLVTDPAASQGHNGYGASIHERGRHRAAIAHLLRAAELDPEWADVHFNLGNVASELGNLSEAADHYRRATALAPDYAAAHNNLGLVLERLGRRREAEECYRKVLALEPDAADARANYAALLGREERWREADQILREGLARTPHDVLLMARLAELRAACPEAELRDGAEAVRLAEATTRAQRGGDDAAALDLLAAAYAEAGQFERAVATAEAALAAARATNNHRLAASIAARLEGYRARRPFRGQWQ